MQNRSNILYLKTILLFVGISSCTNYGLVDRLENPGKGQAGVKPVCSACRLFISQISYSGAQIGGVAGADAKCNTDANRPSLSSTYKAMLVLGSVRQACSTPDCQTSGAAEHIDWVLKANQQYFLPDGVTPYAMTNAAGIWPSGLTYSNQLTGTLLQPWSGLHTDKINSPWLTQTPDMCTNWTSDGGNNGTIGSSNTTDYSALSNSTQTCNQQRPFICVEQ